MKYHDWYNCYANGWTQNDITPDAFSHPAKFSKGLIKRIYDHMLTEGYIKPGDKIVDPFGGVGLGALYAMRNGLHWRGVELEEKFVDLGRQNIALWNGRFAAHFPNWGTARLVQGDSRMLTAVLNGAAGAVSSPPYAGTATQGGDQATNPGMKWTAGERNDRGAINRDNFNGTNYGRTPGQLGSMKEGEAPTAAISSPPYARSLANAANYSDEEKAKSDASRDIMKNAGRAADMRYGSGSGNLGNLPPGDIAAVTSPPYAEAVSGQGEGPGARTRLDWDKGWGKDGKSTSANAYGETAGNLGNMVGAVTSPPFEDSINREGEWTKSLDPQKNSYPQNRSKEYIERNSILYGSAPGNIGNATGDTFWAAARDILIELYTVLTPGGYAAFVCGDYVRNGRRVYFGRQWLALCEAVGFTAVEWITAHKREPGPIQTGIFEDRDLTVDRVSFFRRLANQKNPDNEIVNEDIIIVRK